MNKGDGRQSTFSLHDPQIDGCAVLTEVSAGASSSAVTTTCICTCQATPAYGSIYPPVQNLLLAARAAGLGAALITMPLWSKLLARRALGLPWNVTPCAVIPLGWPKGRYGPTTRRPVGEFVSLDRYGNRAFL